MAAGLILDRGPELFARFAIPPNLKSYCGPFDEAALTAALAERDLDAVRRLAADFHGAMPYLRFIAAELATADPLALDVVAAYWLGTDVAGERDTLRFGNTMFARFADRLGADGAGFAGGIAGGRPTHAYHVFCVYPWVGLLRAGDLGRPLEVLEECRVGWGTVGELGAGWCRVTGPSLSYAAPVLSLGDPIEKDLVVPPWFGESIAVGDEVAHHWGTVAVRISEPTRDGLERDARRHIRLANAADGALADMVERTS